MRLLPDWIPNQVIAGAGGGLAALLAAFLVINVGLRVVPAGRRFLAEARAQGRMFANPTRRSQAAVLWVFALAWIAAGAAAVAGYAVLIDRLVPVHWPAGRLLAELRP
ncbi:MAG: hypothetical protein AAGC57_04175 [Pseudomonadota bacterium]